MLYDVMMGLRSSRKKLLAPDEMACETSKLLAERERLESEIAELAGQTRIWCQRGVEIAEIDDQVVQLRSEARERQRRARRVEVAMGIRPQWTERLQTDARIESLRDLHPLDTSALADLDELNDRIEHHERESATSTKASGTSSAKKPKSWASTKCW